VAPFRLPQRQYTPARRRVVLLRALRDELAGALSRKAADGRAGKRAEAARASMASS
jgi:hypothetical protein